MADKYGITGKLRGQPVNIHRGAFQRPVNEEDWTKIGKAKAPPAHSLDSICRLADASRRMG